MELLAAINRIFGSDMQINLLRGAVILLFAVAAGRRFWAMHHASGRERPASKRGATVAAQDPWGNCYERGYVDVTWATGHLHPDVACHGPLNVLSHWDAGRVEREADSIVITLHDLIAWKPGAPKPLVDLEDAVFFLEPQAGSSSRIEGVGALDLECRVVACTGRELRVIIGLVRAARNSSAMPQAAAA